MTTIEYKLAKFEELTDSQKEQAMDRYRDWNVDGGYDWYDGVYEDATTIAELMGIDVDRIYFSGFSSQGDGACFEGSFSYKKGMVKAVKAYAPLDKELHNIALSIQELHRKAFYGAYGKVRHSGHYYHERSMSVNVDSEKGMVDEDEWRDVFADFALWIYRNLEKEYEYLTSDEAVAESLEANEMEFEIDEDGDICW
jgi:hypothetical protein